jgi:hypothetical protein
MSQLEVHLVTRRFLDITYTLLCRACVVRWGTTTTVQRHRSQADSPLLLERLVTLGETEGNLMLQPWLNGVLDRTGLLRAQDQLKGDREWTFEAGCVTDLRSTTAYRSRKGATAREEYVEDVGVSSTPGFIIPILHLQLLSHRFCPRVVVQPALIDVVLKSSLIRHTSPARSNFRPRPSRPLPTGPAAKIGVTLTPGFAGSRLNSSRRLESKF